MEKYIGIDVLPVKQQKNKTLIDWDKCKNHTVQFKYGEHKGVVKIIDSFIKNKKRTLILEYKEKRREVLASNFKKCEIKKIITDGYNHKIGEIINNCKIVGKRLNPRSKEREYLMLCLETDMTFYRRESRIDKKSKSPYITGKIVHEGNWLFNEKDILKYLKDIDDSKKFTKFSRKNIDCVCPNCKTEKSMPVNNLVQQGFFAIHVLQIYRIQKD